MADNAETMSGQILALAETLTKAGESERTLLKLVCEAQEQALERTLRAGVTKEDCASAFICAASFLSAAAMEDARTGGGEELSFLRAGELTETKRTTGEQGAHTDRLRGQARALMRPYTKDGGAYFCGVQG